MGKCVFSFFFFLFLFWDLVKYSGVVAEFSGLFKECKTNKGGVFQGQNGLLSSDHK